MGERRSPSADVEDMRARIRDTHAAVPTSGLGRLLRTGRSAAGMALSTLGGRLRTDAGAPSPAEVESLKRLVGQLGELKGVAMKAGQISSYVDPSLSAQAREILSVLQTSSASTPFGRIEQLLRDALGARAGELLARMDPRPVAVASIGQVHRAALADGTPVAVKVRHPGIRAALESDFRLAGLGASFAAAFGAGALSTVRGFIAEAHDAILEECDFALEARRQIAFAELFAGDPRVIVPRVVGELSADDVLTTEWTEGLGLEAWLAADPPQEVRDAVGEALFRFYVGALYEHGLFHADPHPGNYAFRRDGRIVFYDFGCVRSFDAPTLAAFAALVAAVRADERAAIGEALERLGGVPPGRAADAEHARALLRGFFAPLLEPGRRRVDPGAGTRASELMRDKRALARLALPGKLLFLFRLRFGLYAVLARVGAEADWAALESGWARAAGRAGGISRA